MTGTSNNNIDRVDFVTIKYNSNGQLQWEAIYLGSNEYSNKVKDIAVDDAGNVFIVGKYHTGINWDMITIKYSQAQVGINEFLIADQILLYPNPNTGEFIIEFQNLRGFQNLAGLDVKIKLLNPSGQVIYKEKISGFKGSYRKEINMKDYAKGIYNLQIITDKGLINKKVVKE